jgi:hypothetical protein
MKQWASVLSTRSKTERGREAPSRPANVGEGRAAGVWREGASRAKLREWRCLVGGEHAASVSRRRAGLRPPANQPTDQPVAAVRMAGHSADMLYSLSGLRCIESGE